MLDINFKKFRKYLFCGLLLFAVSSILCATGSFAADSGPVFGTLVNTGTEIFDGMKKIIFAAAGFGIIAVALGAVFGALNWKWLAAIIIGVVVIAATGGLLAYMSKGTGADKSVEDITQRLIDADTISKAMPKYTGN